MTRIIPSSPGVYFFKNRAGKTIYIGKAQNLKMRLASYFRGGLDTRKNAMLQESTLVDWQGLESDIEALIQEAELIKRHRPKYNVVMRDDKRYFYVGFTLNQFPKLFLTHQPFDRFDKLTTNKLRTDSTHYIGPFTDGGAIKTVLHMLRKIFPYCQCSLSGKTLHIRPCQSAELDRCLGICCLKKKTWPTFYPDVFLRKKTYQKHIQLLKKILSGKHKAVAVMLKKEMGVFAQKKEYEKAAALRNQIRALENVFSHREFLSRDDATYRQKGTRYLQTLLGSRAIRRIEAFDISNLQGQFAVGSMAVFTDGKPDKNEYRKFRIKLAGRPNDVAMIKETLSRRLAHRGWATPDVILIDGGKAQLNAALLANRMCSTRGKKKNIKIVALAKREEELYLPSGKVIKLKENPQPLLHLLQAIRNEAHRFAISYHKNLRSKDLFK